MSENLKIVMDLYNAQKLIGHLKEWGLVEPSSKFAVKDFDGYLYIYEYISNTNVKAVARVNDFEAISYYQSEKEGLVESEPELNWGMYLYNTLEGEDKVIYPKRLNKFLSEKLEEVQKRADHEKKQILKFKSSFYEKFDIEDELESDC